MSFVGGVALLAVVMGLLARRQLQSHANAVETARRQLQLFLELRHELARKLLAYCANSDAPALQRLKAVLQQAEFTSGLAMKARVEEQLTRTLSEVVSSGENQSFKEAAAELPGTLEAIRRAAKEHNDRVAGYNEAISRMRTAARFFGCEKKEEFELPTVISTGE